MVKIKSKSIKSEAIDFSINLAQPSLIFEYILISLLYTCKHLNKQWPISRSDTSINQIKFQEKFPRETLTNINRSYTANIFDSPNLRIINGTNHVQYVTYILIIIQTGTIFLANFIFLILIICLDWARGIEFWLDDGRTE
ncbi:hypothetical protein BpHYR1_027646 [Brachionus plicatilis]|uniref:Uncharacterized protein n=1 Tax=Brachionus plicatilis TaxID=10195 RepID=A0A3M7S3C9_BRAPC|nr:hypothetical protein BpHYR1_027646 [Brachionus plicatilis]